VGSTLAEIELNNGEISSILVIRIVNITTSSYNFKAKNHNNLNKGKTRKKRIEVAMGGMNHYYQLSS